MTWLKHLRRVSAGSPRDLVRAAVEDEERAREEAGSEGQLRRVLRQFAKDEKIRLRFGRLVSTNERVEIPLKELIGVSMWSTGATGSGKSAHGLALELSLFRPELPAVFWKIDGKGESSPWITDDFLPAILSGWKTKDVDRFFENYRVINPFDPSNLPPMNVLSPVAGVPPALQAKEVAVLIAESLGGGSAMGHRMTTVLTFALRLALSVGGLSLVEVKALLTNPNYLSALLSSATDSEAREYFMYRYPKESREAVQAVMSRLDLLLLIDDTARVLAAPGALDISRSVNDGFTIATFGGFPHGAEYLGQFWLGIMFRALARAVMGRLLHGTTKPLFGSVDEWQTALDPDLATHFERLLTLSRFKKASWFLTNQLAGQIGSRYPQLLATLKNSCGVQIAFRQSHDDALALRHMLPKAESTAAKRGSARGETSREDRVEELARLPDRSFWLYWKKRGLEAVKLSSPTVNFAAAKRRAEAAPKEICDACQGRAGGLTRRFLDDVLARRRAHIEAVASGSASHARPDLEDRSIELAEEPANFRPIPADSSRASREAVRQAELEPQPDDAGALEPGAFPFLG